MQRFLASFLLAASAVLGRPASLEITDAGDTTTTNGCPTCASAFTEWTITDLEYHASYIFSTPAHQNSWGYVSFNVTNPAVPYVVPCTAASSQLSDFFYGTMIYECPVPAGSGGALTFTYNRPTGELALNQTWICRDDPQYPARFNAGGKAIGALDCTETTYNNPDWQIGEIYSDREVKCVPITLPVKADWITAVA